MKKKVLVTGSSGFIGSHFIRNHSHEFEMVTPNLRTVKIDEIDFTGVNSVVHLIALVHQMSGAPEDMYFEVNTHLTENLARAAKKAGVRHFIFMSTAHVFGDYGNLDPASPAYNENSICHPKDPYSRSKLKAEMLLLGLQDNSFSVSIIRPPMVYGEGAKGNLIALAKLVKFFPVLPFRYSNNRRSIVYVGNLSHFVSLVIKSEVSGVLLPQDEKPLPIDEIIMGLANSLKKNVVLIKFPKLIFSLLCKLRPAIMIRLYGTLALDSSASNKKLDYRAIYSSEEGFRKMLSQGMA